mgnify:CR=1 FL=1
MYLIYLDQPKLMYYFIKSKITQLLTVTTSHYTQYPADCNTIDKVQVLLL